MWFHFWADILRAKDRLGNRMSGKPYVDYIKNFVASNRPYNEWVEEMLSSTGPMWERGNGGVGYFARDQGMQLDNMSNTVRIFLGTSLECAQCHDHPFDRWTQKQFYEMAAYTEVLEIYAARQKCSTFGRLARQEQASRANMIQTELGGFSTSKIWKISLGLGWKVWKRQDSLPNDYQYDNAADEELQAKTIFGLAAN